MKRQLELHRGLGFQADSATLGTISVRQGDELLRRLICFAGRHHRLGRAVTWDGMDYRSVCRFCAKPLYKHGNVRWRAVRRRKEKVLLLTYRPAEVQPWPEEWSAKQ